MSDITPTTTRTDVEYCANHPGVETTLHCSRCDKPICARCAVLTPTGYRCKECVRGQQKIFDTAQWSDYPLAMIIGAGLAFVGSLIVPYLGFFTLFIAPVAGVIIAEAIRFVTRRRRSKRLFQLVAVAVVVGCLPLLLANGLGALLGGRGGLFALWPLLWQGLYAFTVTSSVYYRLGGIQIR